MLGSDSAGYAATALMVATSPDAGRAVVTEASVTGRALDRASLASCLRAHAVELLKT